MKNTQVCIIILNWNGWRYTIECLESVFKLDYESYRVVVCDNDSSDFSLEYIKAWAEGRLDVYLPLDSPLRHLSSPPVSKVIPYRQYNREEAESVGDANNADYPLILIQTGANLGFAGGNNVGLRYALQQNIFEYFWLLNNDTVVNTDSLRALVEKAEFYKAAERMVGIIGSKLMYYQNPDILQGVGGTYNKWFAIAKHIGLYERDNGQYDTEEVTDATDYPIGASMFVSKIFVQDVGLMCEGYFLYFEEMDWVQRGKMKGWQIGYSWQSKVFHKEGGSIGSSSKGADKSEFADYYGLKNRIVFTKNFFPQYLWIVRLGFIFVFLNRIKRRQFKRLGLALKAFWGESL
ncbi:MAG: glycosyltransferase family 2 protein [Desulfuromonadales bacterium]